MIREIERKLAQLGPEQTVSLEKLPTFLQRAQRLVQQKTKYENKLHALHATEVECIALERATPNSPMSMDSKRTLPSPKKKGLIVGAQTFPGNPFDGHALAE